MLPLTVACALVACQSPSEEPADPARSTDGPANAATDPAAQSDAEAPTPTPPAADPPAASPRFVGRWATTEQNCATLAWEFTAETLDTPAGSHCDFNSVEEAPGGYDIAATCTAEGPPTEDTLELRFAESAGALLFSSESIADAGLVPCSHGG